MRPLFDRRYRHIQRYREIINILSRHGLGHLLELTGLRNAFRMPWRKKELPEPRISTAERLRMVLEELGPAFIKLGQILSTRRDLLPEIYLSQLELLQDRVAPVDFPEIQRTIEDELHNSLEGLFLRFNRAPLASASIGQVHEAFLSTGEHVVVKVQRTGVARVVQTDLEILDDVAGFLELRTEWGKAYQIRKFVQEFARALRDELDYLLEAKNAERFRENFRGDRTVYFPKVHWELTTSRILVLDFVSGIKITSKAGLEKAGINRREAAAGIAGAFFKQLFIDGFFHADPHPGNITISKNGIIIFMDFGMVGRLEGLVKERLGSMFIGIIRKDVASVIRAFQELGNEIPKGVEEHDLKRELYYLLDKYYHRSLNEIKLGSVFHDLSAISARYRIRIPQELALIVRTVILLEHLIEQLDPKSGLIELVKPFGPKLLLEKLAPRNLYRSLAGYLLDLANLTVNLPEKISNLLRMAVDGELKIILEHQNFESLISRLTVLGNRLSFSMIIAATIIGSSLIALKTPESIFGRFPIAEAGFVAAVLMGVWLLIAIIKSGRI